MLIEGNDGQLLLVWRQNAAGELLADSTNPDSLMVAQWDGETWSTPQTVLDNVAGLLGFTAARHDANTISIVYSQDTDQDFSTSEDQELFQISWNGTSWGSPTRLTNDNQADNSPTLFYDSAGQPRLLFLKGDTLHALMGDLTLDLQGFRL